MSTLFLSGLILGFSPGAQAQDDGRTEGSARRTASAAEDDEGEDEGEEESDPEDSSEESEEGDPEGTTSGAAVRTAPEPEPEPETSETSGTAPRPKEEEKPEPEPEPPAERARGLAVGVGTGPLPLNTLSLGLTGLAGRVLIPVGNGSIILSGGHTSFRVAEFRQGDFSDRYFTRAGAGTIAAGYRGGSPPAEAGVVPYGIAQAMLIRTTGGNGDPGDFYGSGAWSVGALGGGGIDGFLTPYISAGVEVGAMAAMMVGGGIGDNTDDTKLQGTLLTTFASAQLTVWK